MNVNRITFQYTAYYSHCSVMIYNLFVNLSFIFVCDIITTTIKLSSY
jgi:hypothetical protein